MLPTRQSVLLQFTLSMSLVYSTILQHFAAFICLLHFPSLSFAGGSFTAGNIHCIYSAQLSVLTVFSPVSACGVPIMNCITRKYVVKVDF